MQNGASLDRDAGQNGALHSNGAALEAQFADRRSSGNGASSNGAGPSNGAGRYDSSSNNGSSVNGSRNGNRRSAVGKELLAEAESLNPPAASTSYANGAASSSNGAGRPGSNGHWADPCEVGQLEACAQERYAGGVAPGSQQAGSPARREAPVAPQNNTTYAHRRPFRYNALQCTTPGSECITRPLDRALNISWCDRGTWWVCQWYLSLTLCWECSAAQLARSAHRSAVVAWRKRGAVLKVHGNQAHCTGSSETTCMCAG